ncbi:MAG: prepilin-type N-terminal cleavage/methylation domain-containing protein [Chitinivibrionales bacterium]|nr:prepilin-type N-terminal cleavage/methylation domain-containing protein [Chitinivibrionales bacterium]MBD3394506.1 prepilin-type N-terminal cleavage/methylation domain-containing protein [Chitinivibrionales bacterium]
MHTPHKKHQGVTLVEVIVVAVIVGILAVVAIPVYLGYVQSSAIKSAHGNCELVAAAVMFNHNRGLDIDANSWSDIGITSPDDEFWQYGFDGIGGNVSMPSNYAVTVEGKPGSRMSDFTGGKFYPQPAANQDQWVPPQ